MHMFTKTLLNTRINTEGLKFIIYLGDNQRCFIS